MKNILLIAVPVLACLAASAQSVDVIKSSQTVDTRTYLLSAIPRYEMEGGTNMVCVSIQFNAVTERRIGGGEWQKVSEESRTYTKAGVNGWVNSYTNAQGTVVTNTVKTGLLLDISRADSLPGRWRQIILIPQATVTPASE